jgi:hypothetical protein
MEWIILIVLVVAALAGLAVAWRPMDGTTLRAAWWWSVAAIVAVAAADALTGDSAAGAPVRFMAAILTFCPTVAVFGAKRPQDRAWQWVVLAFWGVLSLPAAEAWLLHSESQFQLHAVWSWFLAGMIVVSCANYLFTRFWASAVAVALGQWLLLADYLPLRFSQLPHWTPTAGLAALTIGVYLAMNPARSRLRLPPLDRVFLDFRDQYGVVWGLRIAERINASARMYHWPVRLEWHGFQFAQVVERSSDCSTGATEGLPAGQETFGPTPWHGQETVPQQVVTMSQPTQQLANLEQSFRTLLRRFVSPEWIDRRMNAPS